MNPSDQLPLCLYEAVLSLYPLGADDQPLSATPIWWGALANGLRLNLEYEDLVGASSGDKYARAHHLDEKHTLEIERTWLMRKPTLAAAQGPGVGLDFVPGRNTRYALEIVWWSASGAGGGGYWYRRWYWGVTAKSAGWDSLRALTFGQKQSWRAERFTEEGGTARLGQVPVAVATPLPGSITPEQSLEFAREQPLLAGTYLMGRYQWPGTTVLTSARVTALAPQGTAVVLGLEAGGVLTGDTLTLPVGAANTEGSVSSSLAVSVPPLTDVRWKVVSGPATASASAYNAAVTVQATPADERSLIGFFHESPLVPGTYLLGRYRWPVAAVVTSARVTAMAPQVAAVVLGLEVGGVLTGDTLTLPVGAANTEVSAAATLSVPVPALTNVRWKVTSAPGAASSAWVAAVGMQVTPMPTALSLIFQRSGAVPDGSYLLGTHQFRQATRLLSAELTCQPPSGGSLRLELEVGGVLTGLAFAVGGPADQVEARQSLALGWPVAAGTPIRWKATFTGAAADAVVDAVITVSAAGQ